MQGAPAAKIDRTSLAQAEALARRHFGIGGSVSVLSSERDETFLIRAADGCGYILKIAAADERADVLQFQSDALAHLSTKKLAVPVPRPVASVDGEMLVRVPSDEGPRTMRVLTYLEGMLLSQAPRRAAQLAALGRALASVGGGLADFHMAVPQQDLIWDLCRAGSLYDLVPYVEEARRPVVTAALDAYGRLAETAMADLPRQVIHNDFNPHNILVDPAMPEKVTGIIDFGDVVEAPAINDLAVALAYHVFSGPGLDDVAAVLSAYAALRPLSPLELTCLPTLMRTRLAMTIVISEWRSSRQPENSRYILRNHAAALAGLAKLANRSDSEISSFFQEIVGDGS
jgi:Ser/Thr protein kinase RdoA (MazF antagonist)